VNAFWNRRPWREPDGGNLHVRFDEGEASHWRLTTAVGSTPSWAPLYSTECRGLLLAESLKHAFEHRDPYNPHPVWHNFRSLFPVIDEGNAGLNNPAYNTGGHHEWDQKTNSYSPAQRWNRRSYFLRGGVQPWQIAACSGERSLLESYPRP
jgi:hypothetical protein